MSDPGKSFHTFFVAEAFYICGHNEIFNDHAVLQPCEVCNQGHFVEFP